MLIINFQLILELVHFKYFNQTSLSSFQLREFNHFNQILLSLFHISSTFHNNI